MDQKAQIQLLLENGNLVKRPFVLTPDSGIVGFKEDALERALQHLSRIPAAPNRAKQATLRPRSTLPAHKKKFKERKNDRSHWRRRFYRQLTCLGT